MTQKLTLATSLGALLCAAAFGCSSSSPAPAPTPETGDAGVPSKPLPEDAATGTDAESEAGVPVSYPAFCEKGDTRVACARDTEGKVGKGGRFIPSGQSASLAGAATDGAGRFAYVTVGPYSLDNKSPVDSAIWKVDLSSGDHEVIYGPHIKNPDEGLPNQTYEIIGTGPGLSKASGPAFGPDGALYVAGGGKTGTSGQLVRLDISVTPAKAAYVYADLGTFRATEPGKCIYAPGGTPVVTGTAAEPVFHMAFGGMGFSGIAKIKGETCTVVSATGSPIVGTGPEFNAGNSPEGLVADKAGQLYTSQFVNSGIFRIDPATGARSIVFKLIDEPKAPKVGTGCYAQGRHAVSGTTIFSVGGRPSVCGTGVSGVFLSTIDASKPAAPVGEILEQISDPVSDQFMNVWVLPGQATRLLVHSGSGLGYVDVSTKKTVWLAH